MGGADAFIRALTAKAEAVDHAVSAALASAGHELEAETKKVFTQAHARGTPTPAQPGQPPAVVSGALRRGIRTEGPVRVGFGTYQVMVGPTVIYSRRQELDFNHPFFKPSYDGFTARGVLNRKLADAVAHALRS